MLVPSRLLRTIAITDVDDTNIESAVVAITGNYANGQDVLAFTNQNGITGSWNATNGTLTLSGSATLAQYQAALRSITYTNTSDNPSTATRTVSFTVNDGDANSNTQTRDIAITTVNDAPVQASIEGSALGYTKTLAPLRLRQPSQSPMLTIPISNPQSFKSPPTIPTGKTSLRSPTKTASPVHGMPPTEL